MQLNSLKKRLFSVGHWMITTLFCLSAIALIWQGAFFSNSAAIASPTATLIASRDVGDQVQDKVSEDAGRAKGFIRDTANRVERTANKNANRVDQADDQGGFFERRASRDADLIEKRAEEDAARTQKAVDNTKNIVEQAVDNIKGAFGE